MSISRRRAAATFITISASSALLATAAGTASALEVQYGQTFNGPYAESTCNNVAAGTRHAANTTVLCSMVPGSANGGYSYGGGYYMSYPAYQIAIVPTNQVADFQDQQTDESMWSSGSSSASPAALR